MPSARHADKRDGNDTALTKELERLGCEVWHLGRTPCDKLVVCPDGRKELAEIKNPAQRWKLTDTEKDTAARLERMGSHLWILQTAEDCAALVANNIMGLSVNE